MALSKNPIPILQNQQKWLMTQPDTLALKWEAILQTSHSIRS